MKDKDATAITKVIAYITLVKKSDPSAELDGCGDR